MNNAQRGDKVTGDLLVRQRRPAVRAIPQVGAIGLDGQRAFDLINAQVMHRGIADQRRIPLGFQVRAIETVAHLTALAGQGRHAQGTKDVIGLVQFARHPVRGVYLGPQLVRPAAVQRDDMCNDQRFTGADPLHPLLAGAGPALGNFIIRVYVNVHVKVTADQTICQIGQLYRDRYILVGYDLFRDADIAHH